MDLDTVASARTKAGRSADCRALKWEDSLAKHPETLTSKL